MKNYHQKLSDFIQFKTGCSESNAQMLTNIFELKEFKRNDYLFEIGNKNKYIGFLVSGVFRLFTLDNDGNENNLFFALENGFIIGNLTANMKCAFNAQALTNAILLIADFKEYNNLISKNVQLTELHENIFGNIHDKIKDRITKDFFNNAKKNYQAFLNNYPGLLNRIPHHYIASYLGITPTQLSRVRKDFSE